MRVFIGDQVFRSPRVLSCTLRRRTVVFAFVSGPSVDLVFRVRVRTHCLRCGLGELVGLACVRTRESESL